MKSAIYCDGACSGNPGPGGFGTIILQEDWVLEIGAHFPLTTNNQMELRAVIEGLNRIKKKDAPLLIVTDSSYVLNGATKWIKGWTQKGFIKSTGEEVKNKELWIELAAELKKFEKISWKLVMGHAGIPSNERADQIAVSYSQNLPITPYDGPLSQYDIDLEDLSGTAGQIHKKNRKKAKAYSYLSLVNGCFERHQSWEECEQRVKGQPQAKFKKAISREDEYEIMANWGIDPSTLKS